ncbi:MAG: hypothetical protein P1V20_22580 [Verrucomicrobiales bacterium]|nr:hypothetical protein [Verrucomicrobiales bacterium]
MKILQLTLAISLLSSLSLFAQDKGAEGIRVFKWTGYQCSKEKPISLEEHKKDLLMRIGGEENLISSEQKTVKVPTQCGLGNGTANTFLITEHGFFLLNHGFLGNGGFEAWPHPEKAKEEVGAQNVKVELPIALSSVGMAPQPTLVKELIGKTARVYTTGDILTEDYRNDRINIELSKSGIIVRIWRG